MALMSQRAYARHRAAHGLPGTTHRAVQKALESGRIKANEDGLIDSEAADRAWEANSSEGHRRNAKQESEAAVKAAKPKKRAAKVDEEALRPSEPIPQAEPGMTLAEASALEKVWKARLAELDFEERSGRLVPAEEVVARWVELVTISKTKLLALPGKAKARIPSLTPAEVGVIDELVREALEELAQDAEEDAGDGA